ncbi:MAG TPA: addiction module protein [Gemmatimonadota bacterium]|nr:addiction module protein [Gemmatimonadota bacterium]
MTPEAIREEILKLSAEERLRLVEEIWDSLAADAERVPVPAWHRRELDRRLSDSSPKHVTSKELHTRLNRSE